MTVADGWLQLVDVVALIHGGGASSGSDPEPTTKTASRRVKNAVK